MLLASAAGWLVVEDFFTVLVLVLMPALVSAGESASPALALAVAMAKVAVLVVFTTSSAGGRSRGCSPTSRGPDRASCSRSASSSPPSCADVVVSGEGEVALGFVEAILARLGATAEQIDRERARVHAELGERG